MALRNGFVQNRQQRSARGLGIEEVADLAHEVKAQARRKASQNLRPNFARKQYSLA